MTDVWQDIHIDGHTDIRNDPNCIVIKNILNCFFVFYSNIRFRSDICNLLDIRYPAKKVPGPILVLHRPVPNFLERLALVRTFDPLSECPLKKELFCKKTFARSIFIDNTANVPLENYNLRILIEIISNELSNLFYSRPRQKVLFCLNTSSWKTSQQRTKLNLYSMIN